MNVDAKTRIAIAAAALNGFVGVAAGAFAAHGIADPDVKLLLRTGAEYGLIHAAAAIGCLALQGLGARHAGLAAWLFLTGAAVFSGSLYAMALSGQRWLGAVTPLGGLMFLAGWAALAWSALRAPPP